MSGAAAGWEPEQTVLVVLLPAALGLWWLGAALAAAGGWLWRRHRARTRFGRLAALRAPRPAGSWRQALLWAIGLGLGLGSGLWLLPRLPALWLVLGLVGLALLLEELRAPRQQVVLPEVVLFLQQYRAALAAGHDVAGALAVAAEALPPGEVLRAVERSLDLQIRHVGSREMFRPLEKVSPYLQESMRALQSDGWKGSEPVQDELEMLQRRAAAELERTRRSRLRFAQFQPLVGWGRAWLLGAALAMVLLPGGPSLASVRPVALGAWMGVLGLAGLLGLVFSQPWLRRGLGIGCVVMLLLVSNGAKTEETVVASAPTVLPTVTEAAPTTTSIATASATIRPVLAATRTQTPSPLIRTGKNPVYLPPDKNPQKLPRHYPILWTTPLP